MLSIFREAQCWEHVLAKPAEVLGQSPKVLFEEVHSLIAQSKLFDEVLNVFQGSRGILSLGIGGYEVGSDQLNKSNADRYGVWLGNDYCLHKGT